MEDTNGHRPAAPTVEPDRIFADLIGRLAESTTEQERQQALVAIAEWTGKP